MNVHFEGFRADGLVYLDEDQAATLDNVEVLPGDVLLNITGASIGRVTQAPVFMAGARINQMFAYSPLLRVSIQVLSRAS